MSTPIIVRVDFSKWRSTYRKWMREESNVGALLLEQGEQIAAAAGDGVVAELEEQAGRRRVPRVGVRTATFEAARREATDRSLTRSLDAGRL